VRGEGGRPGCAMVAAPGPLSPAAATVRRVSPARDPSTSTGDGPAVRAVPTRHGPAAVHVHPVPDARGVVVLGHGAGGGVGAPDLVAVTATARAAGFAVVLVEQPYRVAGRRVPPRTPVLDDAWRDVVAELRRSDVGDRPLVVGGRSSGARVACRTAADVGAVGVVCLAFPVRPPTRAGQPPKPDRLPELAAVEVPVLVVQGERDPFGVPPAAPGRTVVTVSGDHSLRSDVAGVRAAVEAWLGRLAT
jgi:uncharacterized protein